MATEFYQDYFKAGSLEFYSHNPNGVGTYGGICKEITECTFNFFYYGLRSTGGIGDVMMISSYEHNKYQYFAKWLYDMSFFIFINLLSMNIIFGIILDTFGEFRVIAQIKGNT